MRLDSEEGGTENASAARVKASSFHHFTEIPQRS